MYFFIGRQLIQRQATLTDVAQRTDLINQAEQWFTRAISANHKYARAYLGMGAVYYLRAKLIPPTARLSTPDFQSEVQLALIAYQRSLTEAQAIAMPMVESIAQSGLGYVTRLDAEAHLVQAASSCGGAPKDAAQLALATTGLVQAASILDKAAPALEANQQHREAARAYVAQGAVYEQLGCVRRLQNQKQEAKSFFARAADAYGACIVQQTSSPNDRVIREDIVNKECIPYQKRAQTRRDESP